MSAYRILVTGSRDWVWSGTVRDALICALAGCRDSTASIVHGGCDRGADLHAHAFCQSTPVYGLGVYVVEETHRAAWKAQGRGAGPWRNRRMVDAGAALVLAFLMPCSKAGCPEKAPHGSHGASHCVDYAEKTGIPVRRFYERGSVLCPPST